MPRITFSVERILAWADAHHERTGDWPRSHSGPIADMLGENWRRVDNALRYGLRGLPGGSSLAQLLQAKRGVRNIADLPPLTEQEILAWADAHHNRTGRWPTDEAGPVVGGSHGDEWRDLDTALRQGLRGLPGGDSLPQLLYRSRGVASPLNASRLTRKVILKWADQHKRRTGAWPTRGSGAVLTAEGESWAAIDAALVQGLRGLRGTVTLGRLLARRRGARVRGSLPRLNKRRIVAWMKAHYKRTGRWPTGESGEVEGAKGETWKGVEMALYEGLRGLEGGMTLAQLRRQTVACSRTNEGG